MQWFQQTSWGYRPTHHIGWGITILCLVFCVHIIIFFAHRVHSISDLLYAVFPYIVPAWLVLDRIASRTCATHTNDE